MLMMFMPVFSSRFTPTHHIELLTKNQQFVIVPDKPSGPRHSPPKSNASRRDHRDVKNQRYGARRIAAQAHPPCVEIA
jgi:hypothetical protein